jgi:uncharacterized membrane protein YwaF
MSFGSFSEKLLNFYFYIKNSPYSKEVIFGLKCATPWRWIIFGSIPIVCLSEATLWAMRDIPPRGYLKELISA